MNRACNVNCPKSNPLKIAARDRSWPARTSATAARADPDHARTRLYREGVLVLEDFPIEDISESITLRWRGWTCAVLPRGCRFRSGDANAARKRAAFN